MRIYIIFFALLLSKTCYPQKINYTDDKLPINDLKMDLQVLQEELEQNHPGLYNYESKAAIDSVFLSMENGLKNDLSVIEFYRELAILNSVIKDAHTKVLVPEAFQRAINDSLPRFPFALHYDGQKLLVLRNLSNDETVKISWEVQSINGIPRKSLIENMLSTISRDGYNLSGSIAKLNHDFGGYYAYVYGCLDKYGIELLDLEGNSISKTIEALKVDEIINNKQKRYGENETRTEVPVSVTFDNDIAVIAIRTFNAEKFKPLGLSYKQVFKNIFKQFKTKGIQTLIIDVRDNQGGWPEVADELLSFLIKTPFKHYKSEFALVNKVENKDNYLRNGYITHFEKLRKKKVEKGYLTSWNQPLIKPKKEAFTGSIYVLINGNTASQAGEFSGLLKDKTQAVFIGEETQGNPKLLCGGHIATLMLPNSKIRMEIPLQRVEVNIGFSAKGRGLIPDLKVDSSLENVISEKDEVLDYALKLIKKNSDED